MEQFTLQVEIAWERNGKANTLKLAVVWFFIDFCHCGMYKTNQSQTKNKTKNENRSVAGCARICLYRMNLFCLSHLCLQFDAMSFVNPIYVQQTDPAITSIFSSVFRSGQYMTMVIRMVMNKINDGHMQSYRPQTQV